MVEHGCAVVTGAGQGLGRAIAMELALDGHLVVVSDVELERAGQVVDEIERAGGKAQAVLCDVADEASVQDLASRSADLGTVRTWVNNAGITRPAMLHKMTAEAFDLVLAVHARGTFLGLREAAKLMVGGSGGCILNVTSSAGLQGTIGQINYAAAKGAIVAMTKSAAKELARYEVRVNAVAPVAATPMTQGIREDDKLSAKYLTNIPLGRFAEPDEVAGVFRFLASPSARYMTGQVVCIDGGLYMAS